MITTNIFTSYSWVGLGSFVGICAGAVKNFSETGSLFKRPATPIGFDQKEHREQNKINSLRERMVKACPTPGLVTIIPVTAFVAWNILFGSINQVPERALKEVSSHLLYPLLPMVSSLFIGGRGLRALFEMKVPKSERLDISGHALIQMGSIIHTIYTLKSFADHNHSIQHAALSTLAGAFAVTDAIFMYNTTAYTHSIVDVIAGTALPILGYLGFQMAESLCSSVY